MEEKRAGLSKDNPARFIFSSTNIKTSQSAKQLLLRSAC